MTGIQIDRIQGAATALAIKAPCRVASTGNVATLSGLQTIDGVTLEEDDRILLKDQTDAKENGVYVVGPGGSYTWDRAPDFNGSRDIVQGTVITVYAGTTNASTWWRVDTADPVIGTSNLSFASVPVKGDDGTATSASINRTVDTFLDSTDYTSGTTTQLTISTTPATENDVEVYFDGVYQGKTTFSLSTSTITFDAAIPNGVGKVEIVSGEGAELNTVTDGAISTEKLANTAVTAAKTDLTDDFAWTGAHTFSDITVNANSGLALTEGTAPSTAASEGALYTKDTGGQPELFFREESDGDEVQITSGGELNAGGGTILLGSYSASSNTSVDIGSGLDLDAAIDSTYDVYIIEAYNVTVATDNVDLYLTISQNTGSTFLSSGYRYQHDGDNDGTAINGGFSDNQINLTEAGMGNATGELGNFTIKLYAPSGTSLRKQMRWEIEYSGTGGVPIIINGVGHQTGTGAYDAARIAASSGNINGEFYFYAMKKS